MQEAGLVISVNTLLCYCMHRCFYLLFASIEPNSFPLNNSNLIEYAHGTKAGFIQVSAKHTTLTRNLMIICCSHLYFQEEEQCPILKERCLTFFKKRQNELSYFKSNFLLCVLTLLNLFKTVQLLCAHELYAMFCRFSDQLPI